jgi:hypothetical protein
MIGALYAAQNQNAVEVDEQMPERTLLVVRLEERAGPVDAVEKRMKRCAGECRPDESDEKRSTPIGPDHKG